MLHQLRWVIILFYFCTAVLYATLTPPWQAPDEPAHYNYVRYLAENLAFPELTADCYDQQQINQLLAQKFPPDQSLASVCYEYHQPPLYYLLGVPFFGLGDGALWAVRLWSVMLGGGVVWLTIGLVHTLHPREPHIALMTGVVVANIPMQLAIWGSVSNDALASLMMALLLTLLVRYLISNHDEGAGGLAGFQNLSALGLLLGLALLTKLTVYIAVPLVGLTLWLGRRDLRSFIVAAIQVYGLAFVISLPWYLRNGWLYGNGDIFGLGRHDEIVLGQLRRADLIADIGWGAYLERAFTTTFHSFWGQFGWMAVPMSGRVYWLIWLACLLGVVGLLLLGWRKRLRLTATDIVLLTTVVLMGAGYLWYNSQFVQFQGRYLFPALIPIAYGLVCGWQELLRPERRYALTATYSVGLMWLIVSTLLTGPDRWLWLMAGLGWLIIVLRLRWPIADRWLWLAMGVGLWRLAVNAPLWYIQPYLN